MHGIGLVPTHAPCRHGELKHVALEPPLRPLHGGASARSSLVAQPVSVGKTHGSVVIPSPWFPFAPTTQVHEALTFQTETKKGMHTAPSGLFLGLP